MGTINWYADAGLTQWLESGNQFYASNDSAATYYVAQTVNGCIGAPLSFNVEIEACNFIIPTAFTPDNDGDNDVWQIVGLDAKFPLNQVKIYNRWGDILFTSKTGHYNESPWDGKLNGKDLPVGSYYFILEKAEDGSIEPVNGVISILRKP
jgi:gliding motility-associated-like protein